MAQWCPSSDSGAAAPPSHSARGTHSIRANSVCVIGLCLSFTSPALGQSADRRAAFAVSVGLIAPTEYHAPASRFDKGGLSASVTYGSSAGTGWLSPRLGLSGYSARADADRINVLRVDAGMLVGPPSRLGALAPFLAFDAGIYLAHHDNCGAARIPPEPGVPSGACRETQTGLGWQVGAGAAIRTRRGPAPFGQIQFVWNRRGVDGVVFLVGAIL